MVISGLLNFLILLLYCAQTPGNEKLPEEFAAMRSALCDKPSDFIEMGCRICPKFMAENSSLEALLSSGSCFAHAEGFASMFLLRKEQGSWKRLSFFHNEGPMGLCQKVRGQGDKRDLVVCNEGDYGRGAISVIDFDADGKVKAEAVLVKTWTYPFRALEKQKHCSSLDAEVKNVSFSSIEISIFLNSFDVDPPIDCDESETTTSKISNSKKVEGLAVFTRYDDTFAPDEKTRKLLAEVEKSH